MDFDRSIYDGHVDAKLASHEFSLSVDLSGRGLSCPNINGCFGLKILEEDFAQK